MRFYKKKRKSHSGVRIYKRDWVRKQTDRQTKWKVPNEMLLLPCWMCYGIFSNINILLLPKCNQFRRTRLILYNNVSLFFLLLLVIYDFLTGQLNTLIWLLLKWIFADGLEFGWIIAEVYSLKGYDVTYHFSF